MPYRIIDDSWTDRYATVLAKNIKGFVDTTVRNWWFFKALEKRGAIKLKETGIGLRWQYMYALQTVQPGINGPFQPREIPQYDFLEVGVKGFHSTDEMKYNEYLEARGPEALVNRYDQKAKNLQKTIKRTLNRSIWQDGTGSDNMDGLETIFGVDATVVNTNDQIVPSSGTYGGKAYGLGVQHGGTWPATRVTAGLTYPCAVLANDFPYNEGDPSYDCLSPLNIRINSAKWVDGSHLTWQDTCLPALRMTALWQKNRQGEEFENDVIVLNDDWYSQFLQALEPKKIISVPAQKMLEVGWNGVTFEGIEVTHEVGVPAARGYCMDLDGLSLRCLEDELVKSRGPEKEPMSNNFWWAVWCAANYRFENLKGYASLGEYAIAGQ